MLEKLLSLLLHAKSGAVATVLVLGASGALVTATVDNGMTTITITQPGETTESSTTQSTTTTVSEAILALFNRTSAEDDPTSTATGKGCSDEAHERNKWMKEVNDAFKDNHQAVLALGKDAPRTEDARKLVKDADKELKDIRQEAVKLIHGTFDCDPNEDEDAEEDTTSTSTTTTADTTATLTGETAEEIAEAAIALMEDVVTRLEEALEGPEDEDSEEATANTSNTKEHGKSDSHKPDNRGKGHDR